jgi:ABC-type transport system substrate-binding protein
MRRALFGALAASCLLVLPACKGDAPNPTAATTTTSKPRPVRIGVWLPPDPNANTYGGAAVRSLVYPQLFRATPAGKWEPALVEPGSDVTDKGALSARFRLRARARWSDGTPITVSDLRRTLDGRFVTAVDDATNAGTIVVHFSQALPGWRRLWSGLDSIRPPHDGLFGGPYRVGNVTPDLETVLVANPRYYGAPPRIAEVHLVLVPDGDIEARLMEKGELDVIAPPAFTDRTRRLRQIKHANVLVGDAARGGWSAALVMNPTHLSLPQRQTLLGLVNGPRYTDVILHDEATSTAARVAAPARPTTASTPPSITAPQESGAMSLLLHAMQRLGHKTGVDFDLRQAEFDRVLAAYAASAFDVLMRLEPATPELCWTCSYATVDAALAKAADAGDQSAKTALRRKLADDALVLPLWRERPVAAVRDGLDGVSVNGFSVLGPAWNVAAWQWSR